MLVLQAPDVGGLGVSRIGLLRTLGRQERMVVVKMVDKKAWSKNVAVAEIGLQLDEIADPQHVIVVGLARQLGKDVVVVFPIEGIEEPDLSFVNGTGKS